MFATGAGGSNSFYQNYGGRGVATATFDDFVISGSPGPVTTSLNLLLSGELSVLTLPPAGDRQTQATAAAVVEVRINGRLVTGDAFFQDRYWLYSLNGSLETQATGMLANWSPTSGRITTPAFSVDAGTPFTLQISLIAVGGATSYLLEQGSGLRAEGISNMGHTLTFALESVFDLPVGYSVNSSSAGIVENQFVAPVPIPATLGLLVAGASMLTFRLRRDCR